MRFLRWEAKKSQYASMLARIKMNHPLPPPSLFSFCQNSYITTHNEGKCGLQAV